MPTNNDKKISKEPPFFFPNQWGNTVAMITLGKHQTNPKQSNATYSRFHRILEDLLEVTLKLKIS